MSEDEIPDFWTFWKQADAGTRVRLVLLMTVYYGLVGAIILWVAWLFLTTLTEIF